MDVLTRSNMARDSSAIGTLDVIVCGFSERILGALLITGDLQESGGCFFV